MGAHAHDEEEEAANGLAHGAEDATAAEVENHWRTCAAILHLGQLRFDAVETRSADPASELAKECKDDAARASELLGCREDDLVWALTHRRIRGVPSPRTPREATIARDTLAKTVYERNFDAIVGRVNAALVPATAHADTPRRELFIGLLDIFGSEIFQHNGFEQLLINYANDKLQ